MSGHQLRLPKPGGRWQPDPDRAGLSHRGGNPWDCVRPPRRRHRCVEQSRLVWTIDNRLGIVAAVRWCACGSVSYSGTDGRWVGKNVRRIYCGAPLPAWHRAMADLRRGPAILFAPPCATALNDMTENPPQSAAWAETSRTTVEAPPSSSQPPVDRLDEPVDAVHPRGTASTGSHHERRPAA